MIAHGDHPNARAELRRAIAVNPHVPALLLGREALPADEPEFIGRGVRDEQSPMSSTTWSCGSKPMARSAG